MGKEDEAEAYVVHKGEADEGRIDWQAPVVAGLINSNTVDTKGGHWNMDAKFINKPDKDKPAPPTM